MDPDKHEHAFNQATVLLLAAATGVDQELLLTVRIRHRKHNWLHAPWYPASHGGGALTIGRFIHVTGKHDPDTLGHDPQRWLNWTLLMAHEVGHVQQAEHFGFDIGGRTRFTLWAAKNYAVSFFRNGMNAHDAAPFELEAETGRVRLRALLERTGGCHTRHPIVAMLMTNDAQGMRNWLATHQHTYSDPA